MTGPLLLSFRAAAKLLGVGRNSTLPELVRRGLLRPVTLLGRQYIPREQLEDLARHGEEAPRKKRPAKSAQKRRGGTIADLKL